MPVLETKTSMGFKTQESSLNTSFKVEMSLKNEYNFSNDDGELQTAGFDACLTLDNPIKSSDT